MKRIFLTFYVFLIGVISLTAQETGTSNGDDPLVGSWKIDLRPTPESEAYFQFFVVNDTDQYSFSGTFYGSPVSNAIVNRNWSKVYFAFSTSDQTHDYYHSGYLEDDQIVGMTYCPGRQFAAPWTGTKE